ncbi:MULTISPECIES: hypothetical protein [unclassified Pseudonocardia]|uniref:hypothetical protein n=1 Tax=unclassified Pseudonocardia TaxID=2619320 RepID=UPI0001FFE8BC|nr:MULTISPECIES: hypothetical protein [unclassified Pseudonocardia]ALE72247.1 hypothetical protein FRP1_02180 [Pseudonocardia sp. EC080625-04]ALL75530.1 hypothetical protein AD006_09800 [Pseudonocardia sp. EC080610-09]ALL82557.1 hypothetical protein AD017_17630 [Pseudonocardia sp. EC080619-01]OLM20653.1 hypothetical protein Ae707Ps1_4912 [Pseudonocardia sp. Ae707_Ps1]
MAETEVGRRRPDVVALVAGILALLVAVSGLTGVGPWEFVDLRWLLAGTAVVAGIAFLVASLRNSRAPSDDN